MQLGGYGNQVLMQYPNCLVFYGGLTIVYVLPHIENEWIEYEAQLIAEQEEKKRLSREARFEEIIAKNFPELNQGTNLQMKNLHHSS
jgi:hypothetical protein